MILSPHFITGGVITKLIPNKPLAYLLAFLSHFLLDSFPHSDYSLKNLDNGIKDKAFYKDLEKIGLDLFSGIIFIIISANIFDNFKIGPAMIGGLIAIIPDLLNAFLYLIHKGNFIRLIKGQPLENVKEFSNQNKNIINNFHRLVHSKYFSHREKTTKTKIIGISTEVIVIIVDLILFSI
jgi:hypothetical protein